EIDNHILSLDNSLFFNNSSLDIKTGYLFNDRREFEESVNEAALRLKLKTFTYDVKYNLPEWGQFTTIVGVQGMIQDNKNFGEEILIPNAKKTDVGIYTTTHLHLENWDLQGGLRLDTRKIKTEDARNSQDEDFIPSIDKDYTSFNAALGGKYNFSETFTGRLNLASGFRAPNLAELTSNGVHEGTGRYEIGNSDLNNEQSFQTDLAFEYRSEHFEAFANGFYNSINNYIYINPTDDFIEDDPVFNYVQNGAKLFGGEIGFHLHPHPLDWLHWESSFETVIGKLNDGGYLPLIPANTLNNTIRVELNNKGFFKSPYGFITLENIFSQNNTSEFETTTKGYNLLSLGFGAIVKWNNIKFNWGLSATNITNESYINHLSRLKADHILNPGRSINFNLGFTL
ncbi:MAG TPA: TonB-dependent receptor, partial [Flavobacteriaceae bacterium]|nr:TonB-dependent receptor [Flavobacteriaceae bacterium]